jgi:acetyl-CoA carboxylase biotin carboxyl carrier protein
MDVDEIRKLIRVMRMHGIVELEMQDRRGKIRLVRENGARTDAPPRAAASGDGVAPREVIVSSPMVGTFHRRPGPDVVPFVEVGALVEPGQILCLIEAMKMMNEVPSEVRGLVRRVLVDDGAPVEYGAPLFSLEPR